MFCGKIKEKSCCVGCGKMDFVKKVFELISYPKEREWFEFIENWFEAKSLGLNRKNHKKSRWESRKSAILTGLFIVPIKIIMLFCIVINAFYETLFI